MGLSTLSGVKRVFHTFEAIFHCLLSQTVITDKLSGSGSYLTLRKPDKMSGTFNKFND